MQFAIPQANLPALTEKLAKLQRVADRLGVPQLETHCPGVQLYPALRDVSGLVIEPARKLQLVEVFGVSPKLPGGFEFCATLEHLEGGNIIRAVPGVQVPENFRTVPPKCDHCNLTRNRKDTYLVKDPAGAWVQVGHSCVANYLGHRSLEQIGACAEVVRELEALEDEDALRGGGQGYSADSEWFLAMTCEVIDRLGFTSTTKAKDEGRPATAQVVWAHLFPSPSLMRDGGPFRVSPKSEELARKVLAWVREELKPASDYEWNLRTACGGDRVEQRQAGFVASAVPAYLRAVGAKLAEATARANSAHFGTVGKRDVFTLTCIKEHTFETSFGLTTLYTFKDSAGNSAKWFTGTGSLEVGKTYEVKATVKSHDEYQGTAQTNLTRVTVVREWEAVPA